MVIGENVVPVNGYGRLGGADEPRPARRITAYADARAGRPMAGWPCSRAPRTPTPRCGTSSTATRRALPLLESGRLAFELKVGQGAKPGLGGMTVRGPGRGAPRLADAFALDDVSARDAGDVLRCASPGTFTEEILRQQIRLMRNNFPRARVWVKLHARPGRGARGPGRLGRPARTR